MKNISIRTTSKKELANAYKISQKTLATWITKNPELVARLNETHYCPNNKIFTPKQVEMIFRLLGYPNQYLPDELSM